MKQKYQILTAWDGKFIWEIYLGDSIVQLLACTYMVLDLVF